MTIKAFEEVAADLKKKGRTVSLLMGNGFSMAYDAKIFSYNALYDFLNAQNDELMDKLFDAIKTTNFELVMRQLATTLALLEAFEADPKLCEQIRAASNRLRVTLLDSVKELHPEHVYKIPEERSAACASFLSYFLDSGGHIFTTNYDLLLYWVLMRQNINKAGDGFGWEMENPVEVSEGAEPQWSELLWGPNLSSQTVHYLHGALHLFDVGADISKEQYSGDNYLLQNIAARLDKGEYPIFVTAGDGDQKLEHIRHNRYLTHCYDKLCQLDGSLVTFGFNFGPYDRHIIDAINRAAKPGTKASPKLRSIYIGTYTDKDAAHIDSIKGSFHLPVRIFDAKTANVWGT